MPDRRTCTACGHEDWANEMYNQAGPGGCYTYCRNHNSCQTRMKTLYATQRKAQKMTYPQFGDYVEPTQTEGDTYKPREHYGNSAIIRVLEHKPEIITPNSPNGAPGVICDVYDLNLKATYRDVLMMTGAIVDGFKAHVGKAPIVIRWEKTVAKNGRDYPRPVPAVEAAIDAAKAVYAAGDPFAPEIGTVQANQEEAPF